MNKKQPVIVFCKLCNKEIYVQPSRAWRTNFCSKDCKENKKVKDKENRKRLCKVCSTEFYPRQNQLSNGDGIYCSIKCRATNFHHLHTTEVKLKSKQTYMERLVNGDIKHKTGELNPRWKGGQKATTQRRIVSGKANESQKKYRIKNKHRVKEWSQTRLKRKTGRLPKGTVQGIGESQKWLCAVCKSDVKENYHVDHIYPLSKGGKHEKENIQILCPTCNVRKAAKDPNDFLKEIKVFA